MQFTPAQRERVLKLAAEADVVIGGYRPGALEQFGCGISQLVERFPGLIGVQLSAWDVDGPWGSWSGFDSIVQVACGIASRLEDRESGRPGALPVQALDYATGYAIAASVLHMLHPDQQSDGVCYASVSLQRTADLLFSLDQEGPSEVGSLSSPELLEYSTPENVLEVVALPFDMGTTPLVHRFAPQGYGAADLKW
nr:CoA transferase [Corynebacterium poyangense]